MEGNTDTSNWIPVETERPTQNNIDTKDWLPASGTLQVVKDVPYPKQLEVTPEPSKPTTFWQELGHQLYSEPDEKNPTIAYQLVHPLVEGVKQGFKDIGEAIPEFMDSPLHSTLKTIKGAGEIAFNVIPTAVAFTTATHAIKMVADQTPYGKEVSNVLDVPFQLAHKTLDVLGWTPEKDSNGDMAADVLDIVIGGLIAHETLGAKKVGKLKDLKGEVVKDKDGNVVPVEVPTIAGKLIKSFSDLTGITEKAAKGELKPEQMKELADYLESLKKVTPKDIINSAEDKLPTIDNAYQANEKINLDEQTDKQKSDMLHDLVKSGNAETFKAKLQEAKDNGSLTKEQADEGFIRLNSYEKNIGKIAKYNLPEDKSKDATHLAWNVENTASHIKNIENIPEHKQDPIDEANLINLRDQYKTKTKELADILANRPKEVPKEDIKQAENDILLDSEVAWIKKKENWEEVRDNLIKQLQRDPTYKETFAAARKKYREEHPIKTPKENIASQKSFEKYVDNMSDEDKLEFEKQETPKAKTEAVKEEVKPINTKEKVITAKEQREYNKNLIKEREQAEKDILKEEHIPKSEEKGFNSKFEHLISKKNKTKTETNEGDATETATFHLGDDVGYVEFQDGTKINLATDAKTGQAVQMGKRLPKDGSKVTVEAKVANVERPFDRINIHGVDENGKSIRGMLRRTNESSNVLEKTGEKNNPGAYADPTKVGLSEKEQQEIIDKEAKGNIQEQKQSSKPSKELIKEVVSRLQKALPKLEVVYDDTIEGAGQLDANGKTIRINPFKSGTDTPIHEYGHALIDIYGGLANKLVKGAVERLKTTPLWSEVADRYPELSDDMLAKEVLAEAIGREGKKIFEKERDQTYFKNFVDNFFFKIKKLLGLEKDNVKVLAKQLLSGKELSRETVAGHEAQLQKLSNDEALKQFAEIYHKKSAFEKFRDNITEAANIPRALMTSFDMSAPFRQAVVLTLRHPILATRAAREMFKQSFSQEAFDNWLIDMRNNEHYEMMKDAGLYISDPHTSKLSSKEEHFMTNMAQKIPVIGSLIKGSERAYVAYLNKIRTDVFINAIEEFKEQGLTYEKDPKVYKAMAEFINNATGRGNLGKLETSAQTLNTLFFSPRLIASRLRLLTNMVNPEWYKNTPKIVRVKEMQAMGAFIALGSSILLLSHIAGAKVALDPRSSDFGKIQIGKTRLDIWGGFQQWVRATSQILSGIKIAASGKKIDLTKGRTSRFDVAENFALGKLAPIPALAVELLKGHDMQGNKLKLSNLAAKNLVPLYLQDMADAAKQGGGIGMLSVGVPAFFGVGTQTYDTSKK